MIALTKGNGETACNPKIKKEKNKENTTSMIKTKRS
jgi:hypothetical protein